MKQRNNTSEFSVILQRESSLFSKPASTLLPLMLIMKL